MRTLKQYLNEESEKQYSTSRYLHPLDFPNRSPLHDALTKHGFEHQETKRRVISSADGVEHTYIYKGGDREGAHKALRSKGFKPDPGATANYTNYSSGTRQHRGIATIEHVSGDHVRVHHYLSG